MARPFEVGSQLIRRMDQRGIDTGLIHFRQQVLGAEFRDLAVLPEVGATVCDQIWTCASMIFMASPRFFYCVGTIMEQRPAGDQARRPA